VHKFPVSVPRHEIVILGVLAKDLASNFAARFFADRGTMPKACGADYSIKDNTILREVSIASWLRDGIPLKRHCDRINVAFCDGHAETVQVGEFRRVRISPYDYQISRSPSP
jgi:prepilin-type processing-associated H-X9-DG protein